MKEYTARGLHWYNEDKILVYELTADVIRRMLKKKHGSVLDIGCGLGHVPAMVAQEKRFTVLGTDYDHAFIKRAKQTFKRKNLAFAQADAYKMPTRKKYDVVMSTGYLCVGSFPGVKERLKDLVAKDGTIILDFRRDYDLYSVLSGTTWRRWRSWRAGEWYQFGWIGIREALEDAGLRIVEKKRIYTSPPGLPLGLRKVFERWLGPITAFLLARVFIVRIEPAR